MWSWLTSSEPAKKLDEQLGSLLHEQPEQSSDQSVAQEEKDQKGGSLQPSRPSNAQLAAVLDECIRMLREEEAQEALALAGTRGEDLQTTLMNLFVKNGVESDLAKQATSAAYTKQNEALQKQVEKLLKMASRYWHIGYLRVQKSKMDADGTQEMLRTDTEKFMQEMREAQQQVIDLMASLNPKDQAVRKEQLLSKLRMKREQWQERLSSVLAADQTKFLLSLPRDERMAVCKMNLMLKMAENEALQMAMTGAAVTANELAASEEFMDDNDDDDGGD